MMAGFSASAVVSHVVCVNKKTCWYLGRRRIPEIRNTYLHGADSLVECLLCLNGDIIGLGTDNNHTASTFKK